MLEYMVKLSPVIIGVLALLVFFSLVSWAIIFYKIMQIHLAERYSKRFLMFFGESWEFVPISERLGEFRDSPFTRLFRAGYREVERHLAHNDGTNVDGSRVRVDAIAIDAIARSLRKVSSREISRLEKNVGFLATTASTTPFIGLFGTVWGIMIAFRDIGLAGSTSLDIVAPGISEALVTTAIGLAVAIPAVIGYNFIQGRIRGLVGEMDIFSYDFLNMVQKIPSSDT